jgi:hypothetical protein
MKRKVDLPSSLQALRSLDNERIKELWLRYFKPQAVISIRKMIRSLWYKIQCEKQNLSIKQKNITRLNRYSADPEKHIEKSFKTKYNLKNGLEIVKIYKGRQHNVLVKSPDEFVYNNQTFRTLSAVALSICNKKVSGYDFFGLNNKLYEKSIINDREVEFCEK